MPSIKTRLAYQSIALDQANEALSQAAVEIAEAASGVDAATTQLEDLQIGELDLAAIKVNGKRFIEDGGALVLE